ITFNLGFAEFFAPATVLIFSVTFLLTDIVNEQFGKKETQRMILIALFSQIALITFSYLVLKTTGAPFFENQAAFEAVFGSVPRIIIASLIAFYISENIDAHLFQWLKNLTHGKHLWMRNTFSSIPAMFIDSILFVTIAFYGVMPVVPLITGQSIIKWLVGIIDIPFMYLSRAVLGKSGRTSPLSIDVIK
ncbi:MAG: queuosine precursor transporter, partial [Patescibacteria group bacterium]